MPTLNTKRPKAISVSLGGKRLVTSSGAKTSAALRTGYIQVHPDPTCKLYLCMESGRYVVRGLDHGGRLIKRVLTTNSIIEARILFSCMK